MLRAKFLEIPSCTSFPLLWNHFTIIFEPTCAYCTVGSYASLSLRLSVRPSVCPSVYHWIIIHISKSIIAMNLKLCHSIKPLQAHIGKLPTTLSEVYFKSSSKLGSSYFGKYCSYDSETLLLLKVFISASRKSTYYTLRSIFLTDE